MPESGSLLLADTEFYGISCGSTTHCVAVGITLNGDATVANTVNGGGQWTAGALSSGASLNAVSCASTLECVAVGNTDGSSGNGVALATINGGTSWTPQTLPSGTGRLFGVSCPSPQDCFAVGEPSTVLATSDGGRDWVDQAVPNSGNGGISVTGVSCASTMQCIAVYTGQSRTGYLITANGGASWINQGQTTPSGDQVNSLLLGDVSCPSASDCFASGSAIANAGSTFVSAVLATTNGGTSWVSQSVGGGGLSGIACSTTIDCEAGSGNSASSTQDAIFGTVNAGATWTAQTAPLALITTMACPSATTCFATGGSTIIATTNGGNTWAAQPIGTVSDGYWLVGADGGIFSFGSAQFYGSTGSLHLQRPVVGIASSPDRAGYWLVASDGGIFAFGDAGYLGSIPGLGLAPAGSAGTSRRLNAPIVAMVPSPTGDGYFLVGADGGVFAFGDAHFAGSCPQIGSCDAPAVAVIPDATGDGYWLVTSVGSVYSFGDARYFGGGSPTSVPVTSAIGTPDGGGYWLLYANGGVDAFGDAGSFGGPTGHAGGLDPATAIYATNDGSGYWVATADGSVYAYGDAVAQGGASGTKLNAPIIAASTS